MFFGASSVFLLIYNMFSASSGLVGAEQKNRVEHVTSRRIRSQGNLRVLERDENDENPEVLVVVNYEL